MQTYRPKDDAQQILKRIFIIYVHPQVEDRVATFKSIF
jgi:hypothetical protein